MTDNTFEAGPSSTDNESAPFGHVRRFIVIGPGAAGGVLAGELSRGGQDVLLVARGREFEALSTRGLHYFTTDGSEYLQLPVVNEPADVALTPGDVLLFTVRNQDVDAALRTWAAQGVQLEDGTVTSAGLAIPSLMVQNGLHAERSAARYFRTVYGAMTSFLVGKYEVGEAISFGREIRVGLWLGAYVGGSNDERSTIAASLRRAPAIKVQEVDNLRAWKAAKLTWNTVNGVEVLFAPSELRDELAARLYQEASDVLQKAGIEVVDFEAPGVSEIDIEEGEKIYDVPGKTRTNGTVQSLLRGAPTEIDYLTGEIVRIARENEAPVPLNEAIQYLVTVAFARKSAVGALGDAEIASVLALAEPTEPSACASS